MKNVNPEPSNARDDDSRWIEMDGVQVEELAKHDLLSIRTANSEYEIVVIHPESAHVMVRGGHHFPDYTFAYLSGSSLNSSITVHGISVGYGVELFIGNRRIKTSTVRKIRLFREAELAA
jgi:hypothetical protein